MKAGFGDYLGFLSAFGYFISACLGNTFYWVLIKSTLGGFFPIFGNGDTLAAVVVSSICIWIFHFTVLRGVQQAAAINKIVTVAKIVPILLFILILAVSFKGHLFAANFWGGEGMPATGIFDQVRATMLVTVFVFLGIEGASVYSRYARTRADVGTATILGFLGVAALLVLVTLLSYSVLPRAEIAGLRQPSMATVLEAVVGHWGLVFISLGLIVSVLGAYLAWQMIAAEVLFNAAKTDDMPRIFATENQNKVPSASWLISPEWNASLPLPLTRRWFNGASRDFTIEPIGILEYVIPANWIGGPRGAAILGNPAVDFLVFHERNWSTASSFEYGQWLAGIVLKAGWRF